MPGSWREAGKDGGALKASGSSARSDRGQLSGQLMSLAASLIGLKQEGPAKFSKPVEESFQTEVPEQGTLKHVFISND